MQHLARDLEIFRLTHSLTHDHPQPSHVTHKPGCLFLFFFLPPTSHTLLSHITHTLHTQPSWHCETAPLSVSYARQDFIALAVILAVILYMRQPLFLIYSVLGDLPARPRKTGCPLAESCVSTNIFADWPQDPHRLYMTILPTYLPSLPTYPPHLYSLAQS